MSPSKTELVQTLEQRLDARFTAMERRLNTHLTAMERRLNTRLTAIEQRSTRTDALIRNGLASQDNDLISPVPRPSDRLQ